MGNRRTGLAAALVLCLGALGASPVWSADDPGQAQLDFANGLFQRGFNKEAMDEYKSYLDKFPAGPAVNTALYRMGEAAYAAKEYAAALDAFDRYLAAETDAAGRQRASLSRGEVLLFLKRGPEAEKALDALTGADVPPEVRSRALYFSGKAKSETGNHAGAAKAFKTLMDAYPDGPLAPFARYQLAYAYLAQNEMEKAAGEFSASAANAATDKELRAEARFRAGEAYDKIGWFAQAVGAYEQLQKEFPDSPYAQLAESGYAWALYHAGKHPEAAAAADALIKKRPNAPETVGMLYLLGNCQQQQKQYDAAIATYTRIRTEQPASEFAGRALYKLGWCHYLAGKLDEAKQEVSQYLQQPTDPNLVGDAAFLLGSILVAKGEFEAAYEEFRLVSEKYAGGEFGAESSYKAAECLAQLGKTKEAAKAFEAFAKQYPDDILAEQAILRAGDADFQTSSFEGAVEKYKKILEASGDATVEQEALYRLAVTYHNMKNYEASVATFRKLVEKYPTNARVTEARLRIGDYLLREGKDPVKAIEEYNAVLAADAKGSHAGRAVKGMALARYETKDYDAAAESFLRLITEFPAEPLNEETYVWLGQRLYDQKKWDQAAIAFGALLTAKTDYPNPERIRFKIAECSEAAGKLEEAVKLFEAAAAAAPQSTTAVDARFHIAKLYEGLNKPDEAFKLYEEAANTNTGELAARARFRLGELYEAKGDFPSAAKSYMCVVILFLFEELSPEALWRAGQCFEKAGSREQAKKAYDELLKDYGQSPQAGKAREALSKLG